MVKKCPGGKIRSKGRGKGLGSGNKRGPRGIPTKNVKRGRGRNAVQKYKSA